jgi:hypothetical protein
MTQHDVADIPNTLTFSGNEMCKNEDEENREPRVKEDAFDFIFSVPWHQP